MARKKRRQHLTAGELNLTAMIDVAFQLLSFFIITIHPQDVLTNLNVFRPSQENTAPPDNTMPNMIRIMIYQNAFTLNEGPITFKNLETAMGRLASHDKAQTILIMVRAESKHKNLVDVLNMCAKLKLTNLSVISSN